MSEHKIKVDIWHWFGIIAVFGLAIYASMLLYEYLYSQKLPSVIVEGNYSRFENPFTKLKTDYEQEIVIIDSVRKILPDMDQKDEVSAAIYAYIKKNLNESYNKMAGSYKTFWEFTIHNKSNKNIGQAVLNLPFEGIFSEIRMSDIQPVASFSQRIDIGILYAGEDVKIYAWTDQPLDEYIGYLKEKTALVYHGGSTDVIYPVRAGGLLAWNIKLRNKPAMIGGAILIFLLAIVIILFYNLGLRSARDDFEEFIPFGDNVKSEPEEPVEQKD